MYNAYQQPGPYGQPPNFGGFPGAPGMGPPGLAAPGTGGAPGMQQQDAYPPQGGFPANFQPPANMPNINFSAPVIRLGGAAPAKPDMLGGRDDRDRGGRRAGLGMGQDSGRPDRERIQQIQPSTKEEIIRTIFVGGITEGCGGDEGIERILRAAGNLRRWIRATDSDDKACKFGFAEYEDPESLNTAIEVLREVEVPVKRQTPAENKDEMEDKTKEDKADDDDDDDDGDGQKSPFIKSRLVIVADEKSKSYIESWAESKGEHYEDELEMRIDQAREALQAVLSDLANPSIPKAQDDLSKLDREGDYHMADGVRIDGSSADIVNIPISVDDELSDIPAEMRETVAKEITAFRDRSNRRDLERLKREEEMELQERNRMMNGNRNRLSPPLTAPSGPAGGANGIPVGPRDRTQPPSGPKAFGTQIPRDYQKGVSFVNGSGIDTKSAFEDEDTDASDEELERRRKAKKNAEAEKAYLDQERRWLNRERSRTAAVEREKIRDQEEEEHLEEEKEAMAKRLREWNDGEELTRREEEYYVDPSMWIRNRASFRSREAAEDDADRAQEHREHARSNGQREQAGRQADDFLNRQTEEMQLDQPLAATREPARFKLSLGAAAQKVQASTAQQKRTVAEVEGLLDEEEEEDTGRRELIPIKFDPAAAAADLTDEERAQALKQLAQDIPTSKEGLWAWDVKWDFVDDSVISERLKPFVEKKIVEYLGVQEQMLVDVVDGHLRKHDGPQELVEQLEGALDEEAEVLVKKLWRMVIFFSESEKKGLST